LGWNGKVLSPLPLQEPLFETITMTKFSNADAAPCFHITIATTCVDKQMNVVMCLPPKIDTNTQVSGILNSFCQCAPNIFGWMPSISNIIQHACGKTTHIYYLQSTKTK
jgi:hypothetical protein